MPRILAEISCKSHPMSNQTRKEKCHSLFPILIEIDKLIFGSVLSTNANLQVSSIPISRITVLQSSHILFSNVVAPTVYIDNPIYILFLIHGVSHVTFFTEKKYNTILVEPIAF